MPKGFSLRLGRLRKNQQKRAHYNCCRGLRVREDPALRKDKQRNHAADQEEALHDFLHKFTSSIVTAIAATTAQNLRQNAHISPIRQVAMYPLLHETTRPRENPPTAKLFLLPVFSFGLREEIAQSAHRGHG
jgi:hypothetical protein